MENQIIMVGSIGAYFIIALYNTLAKEKTMIEEGGEPLPSSSYMFLVTKYLLWGLVTWYGSLLVPRNWVTIDGVLFFLLVAGTLIISYLVATIIEVIIRVLVAYLAHKKEGRDLTKREG